MYLEISLSKIATQISCSKMKLKNYVILVIIS